MVDETVRRWISICGFEGTLNFINPYKGNARVAQWWSIALPRRGPRVRIPSRAFLLYPDKEQVKRPVLLFGVFVFGGSAWIS